MSANIKRLAASNWQGQTWKRTRTTGMISCGYHHEPFKSILRHSNGFMSYTCTVQCFTFYRIITQHQKRLKGKITTEYYFTDYNSTKYGLWIHFFSSHSIFLPIFFHTTPLCGSEWVRVCVCTFFHSSNNFFFVQSCFYLFCSRNRNVKNDTGFLARVTNSRIVITHRHCWIIFFLCKKAWGAVLWTSKPKIFGLFLSSRVWMRIKMCDVWTFSILWISRDADTCFYFTSIHPCITSES